MGEISRRKLLGGLSVVGLTSIAGCNTGYLVSIEEIDCSGRLIRDDICRVIVENHGPGGDFYVVVQAETGDGTVMKEARERVRIRNGERRQVDVQGDLQGNYIYRAFVERA